MDKETDRNRQTSVTGTKPGTGTGRGFEDTQTSGRKGTGSEFSREELVREFTPTLEGSFRTTYQSISQRVSDPEEAFGILQEVTNQVLRNRNAITEPGSRR